MTITGRCYCGDINYEISSEPTFCGQCHCRECQYISGGGPNVVMAVPEAGFRYTKGQPKGFKRSDIDGAVTREFCGNCGTHVSTHAKEMHLQIVKAGTLDDPTQYPGPQMAIYMCDAQPYHTVPEGVPTFDKMPG